MRRNAIGWKPRLETLEDRTAPSASAILGQVTHNFITHNVNIQHIDGLAHAIDPTATTWLVIHGRNDSAAGKHALAESIQLARPSDQVLLLDWSEASASGLFGAAGEGWIVPVASWAASALAADEFRGAQLNVVGHSWGSYVADELAARISEDGTPTGAKSVNSLVALDPATDHPLGFEYNPEDGHINFAAHSEFAWAFHAREPLNGIPAGALFTPVSADEAFTVAGAEHNSVVDVFRDLVERNTAVSQRFSLARLVSHQASPEFVPNRFTPWGTWTSLFPGLLNYEAVVGSEPNPDAASTIRRRAASVMFFDQATPTAPVPTTVVYQQDGDQPPVIGAVLGPHSIKQGRLLAMSAFGVIDDSAVTAVRFYRDTNNDGTLNSGDALLGTGFRIVNSWSIVVSTAGWALGDTRIFVEAIDDGVPAQSRVENFDLKVVAMPPRPRDLLATGTDFGGDPLVNQYDLASGLRFSFHAYDSTFKGGVRVATGDVNGDGVEDLVTGAGPGGGPHIKVFDGVTHAEMFSFFAFAPSFTGGVWVATGDLNDDGRADIIVGADAGGSPRVRVFSGADGSVLTDFLAYGPQFTGGVRVASGDVNGDGVADLLTSAGPTGGPHVRAVSGLDGVDLASFFVYAPTFTGGIFITSGDTDGDGYDDIITGAGATGGPHVKVYSGATLAELQSFFAANAAFTGGVRVATRDRDGDGKADLVTSLGLNGPPQVKTFKGNSLALIDDLQAYDLTFLGGVFVG